MILIKLFLTFAKIGLFTVGGGYAMIPFIQKEAVEVNKWISKKDMLEIISLDSVTPGPISVNMATFIGYKVHGPLGSIIATLGVVLPSLVLVMIIAASFYAFRGNKYVQAVMNGLKPAVLALIIAAMINIFQSKAIFDVKSFFLALIVFIGVIFLKLNPIWLVLFAGLAGLVLYR